MRFLVIVLLCLCTLFALPQPSHAHQNVNGISSRIGKETWLTATLSSVRGAVSYKGKWSHATEKSPSDIGALNSDVRSQHEKDDERIKLTKAVSSTLKAVLSRISEWDHSASSHEAGKQVTGLGSVENFGSMGLTRQVPQPSAPSLPSSPEIGINSSADVEVARMAGGSASPTPIPRILFEEVLICKARNPIWNVGIRNKMGDLLVLAYPGDEGKAETFAKCIQDDVTSMKREEYLRFAMYNCVGTEQCSVNAAGVCSCTAGVPERCINVDYTRALIECKYGPGV